MRSTGRELAVLGMGIALLNSTPSAVYGQGAIRIAGTNTVDFGDFLGWERQTARYVLRNDGDTPLTIRKIRHGCGCAVATATPFTIAPGQTNGISLTTIPNTLFGAFAKRAFIESSDPTQPVVQLFFGGKAVPLVEISPRPYVYVDRIATHTAWHQRLTLKGHREDLRFGDLSLDTNFDAETDFARLPGRANEYVVNVRLKPADCAGRWRCTLRVPVLHPPNHPPVEVVIAAKIGNELFAKPHHLALDTSRREVSETVELRFAGTPEAVPRVEALVYPELSAVTFAPLSEFRGNCLKMKVTFAAPFLVTLKRERVRMLAIGHPGTVPARIRCVARP